MKNKLAPRDGPASVMSCIKCLNKLIKCQAEFGLQVIGAATSNVWLESGNGQGNNNNIPQSPNLVSFHFEVQFYQSTQVKIERTCSPIGVMEEASFHFGCRIYNGKILFSFSLFCHFGRKYKTHHKPFILICHRSLEQRRSGRQKASFEASVHRAVHLAFPSQFY